MRIGYILKIFPKLSETFILNEIIELKKKGHEVVIFSIYSSKEKIVHPDVKKFNLLDNVFYLPNQEFLGFFPWKYLTENLKEKILTISTARYFSKVAKGLKLDILHAHFNGITTQVAMLMSKKLHIPFTFTAHAFDIFIDPNIHLLKKRMENALAVITPSCYNQNYLNNLTSIKKEKIHVVKACANINKFKKIKKIGDVTTILSVGRLVEKKGIEYGILSIKELTKDFPDIKYHIVGSGQLENRLKKLVESLNLKDNVRFLGDLNSDLMAYELSKAMIFILPCIKSKNGDLDVCPLALQEAMLAKIPVVSTNIGSIPELIETKKEGLLVEPKNVKQLANVIKNLLENKKLRTKLCKNARKKIEKEFNIHKEVGKLLKIWEENGICDYKPKEYWENRLQNHPDIRGVGHLSFNEDYNRYLYLSKKLALDRVLDIYSINVKDKSILDVGCGAGFFVDYYNKRGAKEIMGIDITKISVSALKKKYSYRKFQVRDISDPNLNFKKTFDIVNAFDILYHITDDNKFKNAIRNISKACKKDGHILITDIFWKKNIAPAKHVKFRSLQEYKEIFLESNIEILDIFPLYYLLNRNFHLPISLLNKSSSILYLFDRYLQGTKIQDGKNIKLLVGRKR